MKLAENLKALLKKHDITVAHLSRQTNVPMQTIHNWLMGHSPQNLIYLKKVAEYFGVSLEELCFRKQE